MLKTPSIQDLKKNYKNILKQFASALILLNFITVVAQNTNIKSPALETLIQQIDENYVPSGWNDGMNSMDKLAGSIPQIYFTFLGTAMNKQEFYINNNPIASQNFKNLNQEILFLIPDLVDLKNSRISNNDERVNDEIIGDVYMEAVWGDINEKFNQSYKEYTGKDLSQISMASVLDQQIVGGTRFRKVAPAAFSNPAITQDEPNCPRQIYDTGLFLGWGSALLEYTRSRVAPSPFDQIIIEQLQGAYNSVERAARDCEPAIPAWPGWKQKQNYLLNQIEELQSTTNHNFKRGRVYTNINNTYNSWGSVLSIMVFDGQTIRSTTCSTCYFRLGFSTAYAAQAFRQGDEALNRNNDLKEAKRQIKLASGYLMRALKVLEEYRDIQQPRGSVIILCCDLNRLDLKKRISDLIRYSGDPNNVTNCILQANSISSDIKIALDNCRKSGSNNNSYEYCRSKYCPECDDQIVLLETAVNKDCQKCLDKNKDLIAKCMNNGSSPNPDPINPNPDPILNPNPVSSGTKCPLKTINGTYLVLDSNNDPNDKTQIKCTYSTNGLLKYQSPQKNGKSHGEYIRYNISKNIHYVIESGIYNNGIKDGVWKTYHLPNSSGKVVLASEIKYNNGVKILEEFYDSRDFLSKRINYLNGKKSEQTRFFPNGRKSSHITYTPDGKKSSHKAWYDDGKVKF